MLPKFENARVWLALEHYYDWTYPLLDVVNDMLHIAQWAVEIERHGTDPRANNNSMGQDEQITSARQCQTSKERLAYSTFLSLRCVRKW